MLKHIAIRDFVIVEELDLELDRGMTVVTGETGAGKSIMLDALGLCVGDRADPSTVRPGAKRAEITAAFDVSELPQAQHWLSERALDAEENECLLRRYISAEGRSRCFINGSPATLTDVGDLGSLLVDIHSQHAHQSLLKRDTQRKLLDAFADASELASQVAGLATRHREQKAEYVRISEMSEADTARRDLLRYQVAELEELAPEVGEVERLEAEYKALSNADFLVESAGVAATSCEQQSQEVARLRGLIDDDRHDGNKVGNVRELLASAQIQLEEAQMELQRYGDTIDRDPERLRNTEIRLDRLNSLGRKHRIQGEQLPAHLEQLQQELAALEGGDAHLSELLTALHALSENYTKAAKKLSKKRLAAARDMAKRVMAVLKQLGMGDCTLSVALNPMDGEPDPRGLEDIEYLVSTHEGATPGALGKIASGGELSRISLALQVAATDNATVPTMIFDEVDVGIGGAVAEIVGELLHELGSEVQVLCVTHLAQVAAKGDQHLRVSKRSVEGRKTTQIDNLEDDARVEEIARMAGGVTITDGSLAHARGLLGRA